MDIDIKQLIVNVQNGDLQSFDDLMAHYIHQVRGFLSSRVPAQHLIDDLTHDSFVFAYNNIESFNPEDADAFGAWLKAIARNYLLAELKRFKREYNNREKYGDFMEQALVEGRRDDNFFEKLQACMQALPEHSRNLIVMRYQQSLSGKEISEALGRTHSWVKVNLHRIHNALRDCMTQSSSTPCHE